MWSSSSSSSAALGSAPQDVVRSLDASEFGGVAPCQVVEAREAEVAARMRSCVALHPEHFARGARRARRIYEPPCARVYLATPSLVPRLKKYIWSHTT